MAEKLWTFQIICHYLTIYFKFETLLKRFSFFFFFLVKSSILMVMEKIKNRKKNDY